jgi:hypothetical protein
MRAVHIPLGLSKRSRAGAMAINVRVTLAFDNWRRRRSSVVTPAPACLISAAASEESAAVAADSRIVRRRLCIAPAEMAHSETARFRSSYGGANSRRLAFCGGYAMFIRFPAAARSRGRSLPPAERFPQRFQARQMGIQTCYRRRPRTGTPVACHLQKAATGSLHPAGRSGRR